MHSIDTHDCKRTVKKSSGFGEAQDGLREGQVATARGKGKLEKLSPLSEDVLAAAFASKEEYHV